MQQTRAPHIRPPALRRRAALALLCLLLALALTGCSGSTYWNLSSVRILDVEVTVDEFSAELGVDMSGTRIELVAEGTARFIEPDLETGELATLTGHWEKTDGGYLITFEDGSLLELVRLAGKRLVMDEGLYQLTFTLEE